MSTKEITKEMCPYCGSDKLHLVSFEDRQIYGYFCEKCWRVTFLTKIEN